MTTHPISRFSPPPRWRPQTSVLAVALLGAAALLAPVSRAANISKTDDANALNLPASWVGGVVPGANDVAVFDSTLTAARSPNLGAGSTWGGIKVTSPGGAVVIGNSPAAILTNGVSGIDLSAASQNLTLNCSLALAPGKQVWNVNSGQKLTLGSGGTFVSGGRAGSPGVSLNLQGAGTVATAMIGLTNDASLPAPGIIGPWATVGTGSSTLFACTNASGNVVGYANAASVSTLPAVVNQNTNFIFSSTGSSFGNNRGINTLLYTGPAGSQAGTVGFILNGFMNCGSGTLNWTVSTMTIGTNKNLVLNAANADFVLSGVIVNCPGNLGGASALTKTGPNNLILTGANTYSGNTYVNEGALYVNGTGSLNVTSTVVVATGATLGGNGLIKGPVTFNGGYLAPGTNGAVGTLTISNNLVLAGAAATFQLGTLYGSGNDQVVVATNLTLDASDTIHISALGGATNMDTTGDYVLFAVGGTTTMTTTPALVWDGTAPANQSSYSLVKSGNNVVLHSSGTAITPLNPVYAGTVITLNANIAGSGPFTYMWQSDGQSGGVTWTNVTSATTDPSMVDTTTWPAGTYEFRLVATNALGVAFTNAPATLVLLAASGPTLTGNTTISAAYLFAGGTVQLSAGFVGSLPISYQWYEITNGGGTGPVVGATSTNLTLTNVQWANGGAYFLMASNNTVALGSLTASSTPAALFVSAQPATNNATVGMFDAGTSTPFVDANDIAQLNYANNGVQPPGLNYYVNNSTPPGQTFTTGPNVSGYPLLGAYLKHDSSGSGTAYATAQTYTLRVYQMFGTNAALLTSYTTTNSPIFGAGDWVYLAGMTNILAANTVYAFSLANNGSGYWKVDDDGGANSYAAGQTASLPKAAGQTYFDTSGEVYDAAFVVNLTQATAPIVFSDTTLVPSSVYNGQGPVVMQAVFHGAAPIHYQWQFTDTGGLVHWLAGATNSSYTISNAAYSNAGTYVLLASNLLSSATNVSSTPVTLTVQTPPASFVADFAYWNTHPGAASPGYSGLGVLGTGTTWNRVNPGTGTNVFNGTGATLCTNATGVADDGTQENVIFTSYATATGNYYYYSTVPAGEVTLLDTYMDNSSTNGMPFAFSSLVNGVYNVVLFSEDGPSANRKAAFTINGVSQGVTNATTSINALVLNQDYTIFTNLVVTNGTLNGAWLSPVSGTASFNGAQLEMEYNFENPQIFIAFAPAAKTVTVGYPALFSVGAVGPGVNGLPGPLFYQWRVNGQPVGGATNSTFAGDTSALGSWSVDVVITNLTSLSATSIAVALNVVPPDVLEWTGSASAAWDLTSLNWNDLTSSQNGVAYGDGEQALFDDTAASFAPTVASTVSPGGVTVNSSQTYTFTGAGGIGGSGNFAQLGTGTTILEIANTNTGATIISNGVLQIGNNNALGSVGTGPITNLAVLAVYSTGTPVISGAMSGTGSLEMLGSGTLTLSANSTFSGGVWLTNGVINASASKAFGSGPITLNNACKRIVLTNAITVTNAITLSPGTGSGNTGRGMIEGPSAGLAYVTGPIYITAGPGTSGASPSAGGHFAGGNSLANGGLVISGPITVDAATTWPFNRAGNVTLVPNAGSSYAVWQNEGNLILGGNNALVPTATLYGNPGAAPMFDLAGFNQTLAGLYGIGPVNNSGANSVTLTLTAGTAANVFSGVISDNGINKIHLVSAGGTNVLAGANTYTGNTIVSGGRLEIAQATLASAATVTVAGGAMLQLDFATTNTVGSLVLNGVTQLPGVYNSTTAPSYIAGTGSLLIPSPINAYPPVLQVSAGTGNLNLGWPTNLGWILQSNSVGLAVTNAWFNYPADGSVSVTNVSITPDATKASVFFRMVKP